MPRYDEEPIFEAYMQSLHTEKKDTKKEDEDGDDTDSKKKSKAKSKKKGKVPPQLAKFIKKKKGDKDVVKEHHEDYASDVQDMSVGELLGALESSDEELYHRLEAYLDDIYAGGEMDTEDEIDGIPDDMPVDGVGEFEEPSADQTPEGTSWRPPFGSM